MTLKQLIIATDHAAERGALVSFADLRRTSATHGVDLGRKVEVAVRDNGFGGVYSFHAYDHGSDGTIYGQTCDGITINGRIYVGVAIRQTR